MENIKGKNKDIKSCEADNENPKMKVLLIEPLKTPRIITIEGSLESMQETVSGLIEVITPYDDEVAIVCNEEGKIAGMPLNRAIYFEPEYTRLLDIIAGTFFICYAPSNSDKLISLPDNLIDKYEKLFHTPETFYWDEMGDIRAMKIKTDE